MITATRPYVDAPVNGVTLASGRYFQQCVRCGHRWQVHPGRPDVRCGMCVDCFDVDPNFASPESRGGVQ